MRLSSVAFVFPDLRYCNLIITKKTKEAKLQGCNEEKLAFIYIVF